MPATRCTACIPRISARPLDGLTKGQQEALIARRAAGALRRTQLHFLGSVTIRPVVCRWSRMLKDDNVDKAFRGWSTGHNSSVSRSKKTSGESQRSSPARVGSGSSSSKFHAYQVERRIKVLCVRVCGNSRNIAACAGVCVCVCARARAGVCARGMQPMTSGIRRCMRTGT